MNHRARSWQDPDDIDGRGRPPALRIPLSDQLLHDQIAAHHHHLSVRVDCCLTRGSVAKGSARCRRLRHKPLIGSSLVRDCLAGWTIAPGAHARARLELLLREHQPGDQRRCLLLHRRDYVAVDVERDDDSGTAQVGERSRTAHRLLTLANGRLLISYGEAGDQAKTKKGAQA